MKIAICLVGQLKALDACMPSLYDKTIKPSNADVIVCVNRATDNDEELLKKIPSNVVYSEIYEKECLETYFPPIFYEKHVEPARKIVQGYDHPRFGDCKPAGAMCNYLAPLVGGMNHLIKLLNWQRLVKVVKSLDDYDFYLVTRSDHFVLFPHPIVKPEILKSDTIYHYDAHHWGGINTDALIMSKSNLINWLTDNMKCLIEEKYIDDVTQKMYDTTGWNCECYSKAVSLLGNYKTKRYLINSFITADSITERPLNSQLKFKKTTIDGVERLYKYGDSQLDPSLTNYGFWKDEGVWVDDGDMLTLKRDEKF